MYNVKVDLHYPLVRDQETYRMRDQETYRVRDHETYRVRDQKTYRGQLLGVEVPDGHDIRASGANGQHSPVSGVGLGIIRTVGAESYKVLKTLHKAF